MERRTKRMTGQRMADVAIMLHDLAETGVARNALAISSAAQRAGLRTEIWVVDGTGPLITQVPHGVGVVILRSGGRASRNRRVADIAAIGTLAKAFRGRRPAVALSAGNHFHITASTAYFLAGSPSSTRLLFRASNPPFQGRKIRIGFFLAWLYGLRFKGARRIISVSEELRAFLVRNLHIDPQQVVTIANSIDLKTAQERAGQAVEHPWFVQGEPPVVVGIGRLAPQKNFGLLIKAFAQARRTRPMRLVIMGDGQGAEPARLQALVENLGMTPNDVGFAGHQANPLKYLARAGLFVLSSNWEGMSNVLLEALACGCPVVATDCPTGVRELLEEGGLGAIVPVDDVDSMARAILVKLSETPNREALRGQAARHDRSAALDRYVAVFREEMGIGI
jgi:glycosyltransferase involved in cell wall biosynthesis